MKTKRFLYFPGLLGDFFQYDPVNISWTELTVAVSGTPPLPREGHGFASAGSKLYLHGGYGNNGAQSA